MSFTQKIKVIKFVRSVLGVDLKTAKNAVDGVEPHHRIICAALEAAIIRLDGGTADLVGHPPMDKGPADYEEFVNTALHAMIMKYGDELPAEDLVYKARKIAKVCSEMRETFDVEEAFRD